MVAATTLESDPEQTTLESDPEQTTLDDAAEDTAPAPTVAQDTRKRQKVIGLIALGVLVLVGGTIAAVMSIGSSSSSHHEASTTTPSTTPTPPAPAETAFRLTALHMAPAKPVPGSPFEAHATATLASGEPVPRPAVSCNAHAGSLHLSGSRRQGGEPGCRWNIPYAAAGKRLAGSVTVTYKGLSKRHVFSARVGPVPERLVILRTGALKPVAGQEAQAAFQGRWVRDDGKQRPVERRTTRATCRATVPGFTVRATAALTANDVVCRMQIPSGTGGKTLRVVITLRAKGDTTRGSVSARIGAPPAPTPQPEPSPIPPPEPPPTPTQTSPIPGP